MKYVYTLVVIGIVLGSYLLSTVYGYYATASVPIPYPPWVSPCPDYWSNIGNNKCQKAASNGKASCTTIPNVSSTLRYPDAKGNQMVDFTSISNADKCKWSNACGVYWEGISDKPCV